MYEKAIKIIGSTLRSRPVEVKCEILKRLTEEIFPLITADKIRPRIHKTFKITEAEQAHAEMAAGKTQERLC